MIENKKILLHSAEMAEHANGSDLYLGALLSGRYGTKEQTRNMVDFKKRQRLIYNKVE